MSDNTKRSYENAQHAMQTGVAAMLVRGTKECDPKHLRVGINTAMSDHAALASLLIAKGVITHDEYVAAITHRMNAEAESYETQLGVTLA